MVVIIDYGLGNLSSVQQAFLRGGVETTITREKDLIEKADALILPGVGAYRDAIRLLKEYDLVQSIYNHVNQNKPLVGICLGMQLLYEKSYEFGEYDGLGLIEGSVVRFDDTLRVPHMGWNNLKFQSDDHILKYISEDDYVYFLHSFYIESSNVECIAYADYGVKVPAIVKKGSVYGLQFHPEKSAEVGAGLIKALKEVLV